MFDGRIDTMATRDGLSTEGESVRIITIDGPAASGKSTIARNVAERLGFLYVNSGNYYRAVALALMECGFDEDRLESGTLPVDSFSGMSLCQQGDTILLDGRDVTARIRDRDVTAFVSHVARLAPVREFVNTLLRRGVDRSGSVVEGRDIGTVVFPDAPLKIFLTASVEERARRRLADFKAKGVEVSLESLVEEIERRDEIDSTRALAPLKCSEDAMVIDSTGLSIDSIVSMVCDRWREVSSRGADRRLCAGGEVSGRE